MGAAVLNIDIRQGDTFRASLKISNLDLTGCGFKMQLRADYASLSEDIIYELSSDSGTITYTAPDIVDLFIPSDDTAELAYNLKGRYDFQVMLPDGDIYTLLEGKFRVLPEVTT